MAVVARKRKNKTAYYVVFRWHGRPIWEPAGNDRRAAESLDRQRAKEVEAGTYHPDAGKAASFTLRQWFESWSATRTNRSRGDEERWIRLHVLPRARFANLPLSEAKPSDFDDLVRVLKTDARSETDERPLSQKSIGNVMGVLAVMFRDAHRAGHCQGNPVNIAPGVLKREPPRERETYTPAEISVLTRNEAIAEGVRVLMAMCFLGGLREGEACGRRWRDLDVDAGPLWCLSVVDQYGGAPLKTDRPRVVPVHRELARLLEAWARTGFELLTCRKPTPDDFIVPLVTSRAKTAHHTRSTLYKAFRAACVVTKVRPRSLHAMRHTFITLARRGGAQKDRIEKITHNAKGDIVDRYTHWDWEPLCEAVEKLRVDVDSHQQLQLPPRNPGGGGGPGKLLLPANVAESPALPGQGPGSIPGASTPEEHERRGPVEGRQLSRQTAKALPDAVPGRPAARADLETAYLRLASWAWFQRRAA